MESQKAETWRFASNDSSDLSVANRRSNGFLRDRQDWIVFSKGISHKLIYSIKDIQEITPPSSPKPLYTIYYKDDDGYEYTLSLFYSRTDHGDVLQLQHQKQLLWQREPAS
jgi:hypothetical protein